MKKIIYIILFTLAVPFSSVLAQKGLINNGTGKINNQGKIIIRQNTLNNKAGGKIENAANAEIEIEKIANLVSDGDINNQGLIEAFRPLTRIAQPSIDGTVIVDSEDEIRYLPQISYNNFLLKGKAKKILSTDNTILETRNYFYSDPNMPIEWNRNPCSKRN